MILAVHVELYLVVSIAVVATQAASPQAGTAHDVQLLACWTLDRAAPPRAQQRVLGDSAAALVKEVWGIRGVVDFADISEPCGR